MPCGSSNAWAPSTWSAWRRPSWTSTRWSAPLLDARRKTPTDDVLLIHTIRMALRNLLLHPDAWSNLPADLTEADRRSIADVSPGVPSAEAAAYLVQHVQKYSEPALLI